MGNRPATWDGRPRTHEEAVKQAAAKLRDEVDADITAVRVCKFILRDDKGQPMSPKDVLAPRFVI